MQFHGYDVYRCYLAMKQHFSNPKFDFFQYDGRVNVKESTYQQRNDFYFFETVARKYTAQEIKEFLLATFVNSSNPSKVWIGDIKRNGKENWSIWQKKHQALHYTTEQELNSVLDYMDSTGRTFNDMFMCNGGHPPLLKMHLGKKLSVETLMILDMVLGFTKAWDKELDDPVWNPLSLKIKKYKPFVSLSVSSYRELLKRKFT